MEKKLPPPPLKENSKPSSQALEPAPANRPASTANTHSSIPASSSQLPQPRQTFQSPPKPKSSTAEAPVREKTVFEKPGPPPRANSLYEDSIALSKVRANLKSISGWNGKNSSKITLRRGTVTLRVPRDMSQKDIQAAAKAALRVNEVGRVEILREES